MRISIITITGESNYGNSLQNYAVRYVLQSLGHNVSTIKTQYEINSSIKSKYNIKQYVKIVLKRTNYFYFLRKVKFKKFSNKYLNKTDVVVDEKHPTEINNCDCLVFGSDQIWNFTWGGRLCECIDFYTGGFAYDIPKISYSASIGANYIPEEKLNTFVENVKKFKAISVREDTAKEIINSLMDNDVMVTLDPTLMLSEKEWLKIAKKPKHVKENEKFMLVYFLGNMSDEIKEYYSLIAKKYDYRIVKLYNEYTDMENIESPEDFVIDPREFIWLVYNAKIVCTDSFHGSVFSMLFKKPFRCFDRSSNVANMSSRMDMLFLKFGIIDWCKGSVEENIDNILYTNYKNVDSILGKEKTIALDYLKGALELNEN